MNRRDLRFHAEVNNLTLRRLKEGEPIAAGDYLEWIEGNFVRVEPTSKFVGERVLKVNVDRLEPRAEGDVGSVLRD